MSTQTTNTPIIKDTSTQTRKFLKPKQIKPKTFPKIKTNEIIGEYTPENINIITKDQESFTNNTKDNNLASTQQPSQNNSKAIIKKNHMQKNKYLTVRKNIFKNKDKKTDVLSKKIYKTNQHSIPSFSEIFKKKKKSWYS